MGIFDFLFKKKRKSKELPNKSINMDEEKILKIKPNQYTSKNVDESSNITFEVTFENQEVKRNNTQNGLNKQKDNYVSAFEKYKSIIFEHLDRFWNLDDSKYDHNYFAYEHNTCPYCGFIFDKPLTRKRKCPNCDETFIVRTNYVSRKKLVLEFERAEELQKDIQTFYSYTGDIEWTLNTASSLGASEKELLEIINYSPTNRMYDVLWRLSNKKTLKYFTEMQMGLYRNMRYIMAEVLERKKEYYPALKMLLSVFYLDSNGPQNTSLSITDKFPPFDKEQIFIAPGIINKIHSLMDEMNINLEKLKTLFYESIETGYNDLLVTTPTESWQMLLEGFNTRNEFKEKQNTPTNGYQKVILAETMFKNQNNLDEITLLLNEALEEDINENFKARAHKILGNIYLKSDKNKALVCFKKALQYNDKIGVKRIIAKLEKES